MPKTRQNPTVLKPKQLAAITILSRIPQEFSSMQQVADDPSVGVNKDTLYEWFKKDEFIKKLEEESERNFRAHAGVVRAAHFKGILKRQDARLIDLFYQKQEKWQPKQTVKVEGQSFSDLALAAVKAAKQEIKEEEENKLIKKIKVIKKNG